MLWNTDPIETVELVNVMGQATQGLYSGEARHESDEEPMVTNMTVPRHRSSQSDDSVGTWQVQQKRWKPQLRQEGTRNGQSSEVLRNQTMLRIMSENEKCLSYSLEVNFDTGRM